MNQKENFRVGSTLEISTAFSERFWPVPQGLKKLRICLENSKEEKFIIIYLGEKILKFLGNDFAFSVVSWHIEMF